MVERDTHPSDDILHQPDQRCRSSRGLDDSDCSRRPRGFGVGPCGSGRLQMIADVRGSPTAPRLPELSPIAGFGFPDSSGVGGRKRESIDFDHSGDILEHFWLFRGGDHAECPRGAP